MTLLAAAPGATARRLVTAGIASLRLTAMLASPAPASAASPDRATLTRMDEVIREGMERSGMPGFAVAVVSGDDVVHARGFGDAGDGRRATPQTPFLLGSASKSFTALAAMQLGWRASFLFQPDLAALFVLMGALVLVTAALRLATLLRHASSGPRAMGSGTVPAPTEPAPALAVK